MATPVWKGHVSFGLVSIPVKLYRAARPDKVEFRQVHEATGSRVRQTLYCEPGEAIDDAESKVSEPPSAQQVRQRTIPFPSPTAPVQVSRSSADIKDTSVHGRHGQTRTLNGTARRIDGCPRGPANASANHPLRVATFRIGVAAYVKNLLRLTCQAGRLIAIVRAPEPVREVKAKESTVLQDQTPFASEPLRTVQTCCDPAPLTNELPTT